MRERDVTARERERERTGEGRRTRRNRVRKASEVRWRAGLEASYLRGRRYERLVANELEDIYEEEREERGRNEGQSVPLDASRSKGGSKVDSLIQVLLVEILL